MGESITLRTGFICAVAAVLFHVGAANTSPAVKPAPWPPATSPNANVQDLHREYDKIFRFGNRNAASHRWSTFLLDRAEQMTEERLILFFTGFCAVSGSPVRPSDYNRYRLTLPKLGGGLSTGYMHYCCWPCVCDTQDFIRIDTRNVTTSDGVSRSYQFVVIGNPCDRPGQLNVPFIQPFDQRQTSIADSAREVRCQPGGVLEGATLSDHGYVIINMFFDAADASTQPDGVAPGATLPIADPTPGRMSTASSAEAAMFQDEREFQPRCAERAANGYNSGMGEIFRRVCAVSPITDAALQPAGNALPGSAAASAKATATCEDGNLSACSAGDDPVSPQRLLVQKDDDTIAEVADDGKAQRPDTCQDIRDDCASMVHFCYDGKHDAKFHEVDCCATCWDQKPSLLSV